MGAVTAVPAAGRAAALARDASALLAGVLLPGAFAPYGLWPLAILSPAVLFLTWHRADARRAARRGFLFGLAAFLTGTWWTYVSIHDFGQAPAVLAAFLTVSLAVIIGLYYGALGWLAARLLPAGGAVRWLLGLPAGWLLVEWLRGWFLSGFPWLSLGYSQTDAPFGALAPLAGVYGISWACAAAAGAVAALVAGRASGRLVAGAVLGALFGASYLIADRPWTQPDGAALSAVLVQGAVGQDEKWDPAALAPTRELYLRLTREHWGADLIVWPEAAIPDLLDRQADFLAALDAEAREHGSELLLGILEEDRERGQYHNVLVSLGGIPGIYRKRHLVPFGEYFPVPDFVRSWLRLMNLPYTDFEPGRPNQPPLSLAGTRIAPTICYEDAFGEEQRVFLPQAGLLVNVSNDAWFGDTMAPHQHLQIARLRSMETGRWMLRATNNGISAFIDPHGRVVARSGQFETEVLEGRVQPMAGATPWVRFGDGPLAGLAALIAVGAALRRRHGER